MYKAKVKWNGNHYFSGEEVKGSKVRTLDNGVVELFDDEPVEAYEEALKIKPGIIGLYKVIDPKAEVQDPIKQEEYTRYINGKFVYGICDEDRKYIV